MPFREVEYLGDGVYLSHDGFQYWLAANHHENRVVALEPSLVFHLFRMIVKDSPVYIEGLQNILNYERGLLDLDSGVQRTDETEDSGDGDSNS